MSEREADELKPGAIYGGWWFWEPPVGRLMENPEDTFRRLNPPPQPDQMPSHRDCKLTDDSRRELSGEVNHD